MIHTTGTILKGFCKGLEIATFLLQESAQPYHQNLTSQLETVDVNYFAVY
jgi:hypothetical protein